MSNPKWKPEFKTSSVHSCPVFCLPSAQACKVCTAVLIRSLWPPTWTTPIASLLPVLDPPQACHLAARGTFSKPVMSTHSFKLLLTLLGQRLFHLSEPSSLLSLSRSEFLSVMHGLRTFFLSQFSEDTCKAGLANTRHMACIHHFLIQCPWKTLPINHSTLSQWARMAMLSWRWQGRWTDTLDLSAMVGGGE